VGVRLKVVSDGVELPAKICRVTVYKRSRVVNGKTYTWSERKIACHPPGKADKVLVIALEPGHGKRIIVELD
jgi:hypothetical protein